ncbi:hypothetical protein K469DRAFT_741595 [Zopfia rhizophila CBS 207.26]|uniref:Pentatricopeptide repeat domain-containing protein n=1 Tax=Zopfia rhizophila CBS 207.26 TaxID=1314779 RepID=A0A6A6DK93_9PEZI|nr:hypothetical protein K469DRAFT_741595 [Zopfia rhizophila CBS 207.26]
MPTALDRLLASPSALRALRRLVNSPELPAIWIPALNGRHSTPSQRRGCSTSKKAESKAAWWSELLQYRERVYGRDGIRDVWLGMARRGFKLPTIGKDAEFLWGTLIKNREIITQVLDHATHLYKETGQFYPALYEKCMTFWLPRHPLKALQYHQMLVKRLRLRKLPLRELAQLAKTSLTDESLKMFKKIYTSSNERDIYDHIVPILIDKGQIALAREWHITCFDRRDFPSLSVESHPVVQLLTAENSSSTFSVPKTSHRYAKDADTIIKRFKFADVDRDPQTRIPKYNRILMRRLIAREIEPVRFDDPFCARLFATRAFPPASIIKGLSMVGVNEIGPEALRAMGLRTEPLREMSERFKELKEAGIAIRGCVFSLALEKYTMERNFTLVQSILESDQHPDVFQDSALQRKLLDYYLGQGDWAQAHRTLAVLTLFHNDPNTESWNLILQARVRQFNADHVTQVLQDMQANGVLLSGESLVSIRGLLRRRQRGRRPGASARGEFDDLRFVARTFMFILESGIGFIPPLAWREIIRRYGMMGRFKELRRLIFWLLYWYAIRSRTAFAELPKSVFLDHATAKMRRTYPHPDHYFNLPPWLSQQHPMHPLRQLFPPAWQQGLIVWGFKAGLLPNAALEQSMFSSPASKRHYRRRFLKSGVLSRQSWSVGLRTLVELRDAGLFVQSYTVAKALRMQLMVLFGRGKSNKRENRIMEDVNTISYGEYVKEVNAIWGQTLFREPECRRKRRSESMTDVKLESEQAKELWSKS